MAALMGPELIGMALIVALGFLVQAVAGFGNGVVCVTLGAQFLTIPEVVALMVPLSVSQTGWLVWRDRARLDRPLLARRILPLMGVGTVLGLGLSGWLGARDELRVAFGALVVGLALRELWRLRSADAPVPPVPRAVAHASMLGAGLLHGLYGTGGPLLVYALGRELPDRRVFRATLCAVWLALNLVLIGGFIVQGRYGQEHLVWLPVLFVAMGLGTWAGDWLHERVSPHAFRVGVYGLLLVAALALVLR